LLREGLHPIAFINQKYVFNLEDRDFFKPATHPEMALLGVKKLKL
jgi:hypothetical protein